MEAIPGIREGKVSMTRWTRSDLAKVTNVIGDRIQVGKPNKFNAKKKEVDGIVFDSAHEAEVYQGLKLRLHAKQISDLKTHVPMRIEINGVYVFTYECDFVYQLVTRKVYEDAKGYKKGSAYQLFRLKKAIIKAALGITIDEV